MNFICRRFGTLCIFHLHKRISILHTYPPMKLKRTECFETSAYKIQTPENYPEESKQHKQNCSRACYEGIVESKDKALLSLTL